MATAKKTETAPKAEKAAKAPEKEARKAIRIDRIPGQKEQDDVVIEVNGKRYQIQRGVEVSVPNSVAAAFALWQRECADAERIEFELMN